MPIRRSLRLKSRGVATTESSKLNVKKIRLPRKRKVKVNRCIKKLILDKIPRRSTRIRKKNYFFTTSEEKPTEDEKLLVEDLKIEPCEVKLEQIDLLIEKLNLANHESSGDNVVEETFNDNSMMNIEKSVENEQNISPEHVKSRAEPEVNCYTEEPNFSSDGIQESVESIENDISEEQEEVSKLMTEMLNQYKIQNEIDFDEINSISNTFHEEKEIDYSWEEEKLPERYQEKIINNVFFNNTNGYNFKSCFKDRASLTAAFDRHSGQISNETCPYDINETPEAEKVKRFYRKNISDPNLHSWYQYNVASSRRFSKQESDDMVSKPYMERYLLF